MHWIRNILNNMNSFFVMMVMFVKENGVYTDAEGDKGHHAAHGLIGLTRAFHFKKFKI